jgi:glutathione S-transferase
MDALERAVSVSEFIPGDRFTAADVYVGSQIGFGLMFNSIDKRPAFERYIGNASARAMRTCGREPWTMH